MISTVQAQSRIAQTAAEQSGSGISEFITEFLSAIPLWIAAGVVIILSYFLGKFFKKIIGFRLARQQVHQEVMILAERAIFLGIMVLGFIVAFKIVGIDLATLFGFMGLGIGLALKDLLSNFIAGVLILTQKKFKIGDLVDVEEKSAPSPKSILALLRFAVLTEQISLFLMPPCSMQLSKISRPMLFAEYHWRLVCTTPLR